MVALNARETREFSHYSPHGHCRKCKAPHIYIYIYIYIYPVAGPELMKQKKYLHVNEMHVDTVSRESKRVINS